MTKKYEFVPGDEITIAPGRTEAEEARWIAADLEAMRRKVADPFRQREADEAMRREIDFDQMQRSLSK